MIDPEQHSRFSPEVGPNEGANIGKKLKLQIFFSGKVTSHQPKV